MGWSESDIDKHFNCTPSFVTEGNVLNVVKHVNVHLLGQRKEGKILYINLKTVEDWKARKSRNRKSKDKMAKEIAKCDLVMD